MRNLRTGRISKKALAALAVAGSLALQPLGGQAAVTGTVKGKLLLGDSTPTDPTCGWHPISCGLFVGNIIQQTGYPDPCFNQNPDRRKDIFGTEGTPEDESYGGRWPYLNVKDIAKYNTSSPARFAKFTLKNESQGYTSDGQHYLNAELRSAACQPLGNLTLKIAEGETKTIPIPRGTQWFLLYAVNYFAGRQNIHRDQSWTLTFD